MFGKIHEAIKEHPYLSIFFFACTGILFTLFITMTVLGYIPAGFGTGAYLFGHTTAAAIFDWTLSSLLYTVISMYFSSFFVALATINPRKAELYPPNLTPIAHSMLKPKATQPTQKQAPAAPETSRIEQEELNQASFSRS